ncbi:hypothetical protein [Cognatiyoonia sp. IB215182]|uniref:hypothetical protein n=1 Tax=Cognatiyoonia sp. IB215182 TaxID=3097353 RepID=UPI002A120EDE|nr:hypothetical protein [Cognatiyoonia sp. IB215182]MDX8355576.1 hypothetical protein [Cognatiyoonia sp. IB215182]
MPEAFQRAFGPTEPFENDFGDLEMPEFVPLPYRGHRKINPRSRGSSRIFPVWLDPETGRPRKYGADSQVEYHNLALTLLAPDTVQVHEQFGPVSFVQPDGHPGKHYFDLLVTKADGHRVGIAVKPTERLKSGRFIRELESIQKTMSSDIADEVRLVTEVCFSRADAFNAVMYHRFAICRDEAVEERLSEVLASTSGETTICALAERCRAGGRAFRVIVQGMFEGRLEKLSPGRIDLFTRVRRLQ